MPIELLKAYAKRIRELRQANKDVSEPALTPEFKQLLDDCARLLASGHGLVSVPEFNSPGIGRPDIALMRMGTPPRAFIELKAPSKPSDPTRWRDHDKRQFERFKDLPNWAICNFYEFRLFSRGEETSSAFILP